MSAKAVDFKMAQFYAHQAIQCSGKDREICWKLAMKSLRGAYSK